MKQLPVHETHAHPNSHTNRRLNPPNRLQKIHLFNTHYLMKHVSIHYFNIWGQDTVRKVGLNFTLVFDVLFIYSQTEILLDTSVSLFDTQE